jgi:hypothetical protein
LLAFARIVFAVSFHAQFRLRIRRIRLEPDPTATGEMGGWKTDARQCPESEVRLIATAASLGEVRIRGALEIHGSRALGSEVLLNYVRQR